MNGYIFVIFGSVLVPLFIMAVFLLKGKGAFLIAGYNTMSKDEKAKYDEKALCRFVGWLLIAIILCMLLFPVGTYFEIAWLTYCGIALMLVVTIYGVIYMNTGNRFSKSVNSDVSAVGSNEKLESNTKTTLIAAISLSAIVLVAVGILFYQGEKDPVVNILDNGIQIEAMYGVSIDFSEIANISLIEENMRDIGIGRRINGYGGFGETLKGNFKSDNLGETLLFVQLKSSPTIRIQRGDKKDIYISFRNSVTTKMLYNELIYSRN